MKFRKVNGLVCLIIVLSIGCFYCFFNSGTVVKNSLNRPDFQKENLPVRILSLAIATDENYSNEQIAEWIKQASDLMEIQTGIKLKMVNIVLVAWENREIDDMRKILMATAADWECAFDMAIGLTKFPEDEKNTAPAIGSIDTATFRFLIIGALKPNVLAHEIFHAFIAPCEHTSGGLMKSWFLDCDPPRDEDLYLTPEDRKIILQNKWRIFQK